MMEECRADLCALYFSFFKEIHEIFEYEESTYKDLIYSIWLLYIRKGIMGLPLYNDELKKWGQAHTQGAWVFVQFLLENQMEGQEIVTLNYEEDKKNFAITLNRDMLLCYGQDIVSRILTPLHIWKCTGDDAPAREFFDKYSSVNDYFLKIRKIVVENQIPRRLELYHNLKLENNEVVNIETYPETIEGIIESFVDR